MKKNTVGIACKLKHFPRSLDFFSNAEFVLKFGSSCTRLETFRDESN